MELRGAKEKENSTPGYRRSYRNAVIETTPGHTKSEGSRHGRRHNSRLHSLTRTPPRASYQTQMLKHWTRTQNYDKDYCVKAEEFPEVSRLKHTLEQMTYQRQPYDSACEAQSSAESGVPLDERTTAHRDKKNMSPAHSTSSSDEGVPLNDMERSVAIQFGSPSPTREERRKTLYIPASVTNIQPDSPQTAADEASSSESWTGDDIFLRRPARPAYRQFPSTSSAAPRFPVPSHPANSMIVRSPLRQTQTARAEWVQPVVRRSRFRVPTPLPAATRVAGAVEQISDHMSSDADDEDDGEDEA